MRKDANGVPTTSAAQLKGNQMKTIEGPIKSVELDQHRWYTIINIEKADGTKVSPVIGNTFPGEGPSLFDNYAEYEKAAEG